MPIHHDRTTWKQRTQIGDTVSIKGKRYSGLVEFTRLCDTCGAPYSIFVTPKIARGEAESNNFGLKNCEAHRRQRGSVPRVENVSEAEALAMANKVMKEELAGLYARVSDLQAKLSMYELQSAMTAVSSQAPQKMPWEA